jgi:hypothetical protein
MREIRLAELSAGKLTVLFLAVAALSAFALVWMGMRLLNLERVLENQQLAERREAAAVRVVAGLELKLAAEERRLDEAAAQDRPDIEDALIVTAGPGQFRIWPENALLFYPEMPAAREASPALFAAADKAEFQEVNYSHAIEALGGFLKAGDPAVVASARLRMARNLRKAGRRAEALDIYRQVMIAPAGSNVAFAETPADLTACSAGCALLEEMGDQNQLRKEASALLRDLQRGRWRLDRAAYILHEGQAVTWLGAKPEVSDRQAIADAADWLWRNWNSSRGAGLASSGRRAEECGHPSRKNVDTH